MKPGPPRARARARRAASSIAISSRRTSCSSSATAMRDSSSCSTSGSPGARPRPGRDRVARPGGRGLRHARVLSRPSRRWARRPTGAPTSTRPACSYEMLSGRRPFVAPVEGGDALDAPAARAGGRCTRPRRRRRQPNSPRGHRGCGERVVERAMARSATSGLPPPPTSSPRFDGRAGGSPAPRRRARACGPGLGGLAHLALADRPGRAEPACPGRAPSSPAALGLMVALGLFSRSPAEAPIRSPPAPESPAT